MAAPCWSGRTGVAGVGGLDEQAARQQQRRVLHQGGHVYVPGQLARGGLEGQQRRRAAWPGLAELVCTTAWLPMASTGCGPNACVLSARVQRSMPSAALRSAMRDVG